jgi:hypothetical protein
MDGRSVAPLLIDPADPAVPPVARGHILRAGYGPYQHRHRGIDHRGQGIAATMPPPPSPGLHKSGPWRSFHPIEFIALNNHSESQCARHRARSAARIWRCAELAAAWFGHLIDDLVSNTYRALRFVGDPTYGELLYAEFTSVQDWHYDSPVHYELFNMTGDPHQLKNLYYTSSKALTDRLQALLLAHWNCKGATCPWGTAGRPSHKVHSSYTSCWPTTK